MHANQDPHIAACRGQDVARDLRMREDAVLVRQKEAEQIELNLRERDHRATDDHGEGVAIEAQRRRAALRGSREG